MKKKERLKGICTPIFCRAGRKRKKREIEDISSVS